MKSRYFVADDVQELAGGKIMVLGLYTDNVILAQMTRQQANELATVVGGLPNLALVLSLSDMTAGQHVVTPQLYLPNGVVSGIPFVPVNINVTPGRVSNLIWRLQPFLVSQFGTYKLTASVDGELIECPFNINFEEIAA